MVTENAEVMEGVVLKPGVGSAYDNGWKQLWKSSHFGWLLLIWFIVIALGFVPSFFQMLIPGMSSFGSPFGEMPFGEMPFGEMPFGATPSPGEIVGLLIAVLVSGLFSILYSVFLLDPIGYGVKFAFLRAARGGKVSVEDMFACFKNYWNAVGASFIVGLIVFVGLLFLIAPGIYLACKLAFVPYLVVDRRMNLGDAFSASWEMTRGHGWKVFLIGLLSIPITIAGLICLVVGAVIAEMWVNLAFASLYHAVDLEKGAVGVAETAV